MPRVSLLRPDVRKIPPAGAIQVDMQLPSRATFSRIDGEAVFDGACCRRWLLGYRHRRRYYHRRSAMPQDRIAGGTAAHDRSALVTGAPAGSGVRCPGFGHAGRLPCVGADAVKSSGQHRAGGCPISVVVRPRRSAGGRILYIAVRTSRSAALVLSKDSGWRRSNAAQSSMARASCCRSVADREPEEGGETLSDTSWGAWVRVRVEAVGVARSALILDSARWKKRNTS